MQTVKIPVRHFGEPTQARLQVEGADPVDVTLQPVRPPTKWTCRRWKQPGRSA